MAMTNIPDHLVERWIVLSLIELMRYHQKVLLTKKLKHPENKNVRRALISLRKKHFFNCFKKFYSISSLLSTSNFFKLIIIKRNKI